MRTADAGFAINPSRVLNVRVKKRRTIPNFSPSSFLGISTFASIDNGIRPVSSNGLYNLYDIRFFNNTLLRVMNDTGNDQYKDKISYFYKTETTGWTSWQRTSYGIYSDSSPFIVVYNSEYYIGFLDGNKALCFYKVLSNGTLDTTKISSGFTFSNVDIFRSVNVGSTTYIVGVSIINDNLGKVPFIRLIKVNALDNLSTVCSEPRYIIQFDKITSIDAVTLGSKIYLFLASNSGDKGIYFIIDPAGTISEAMPILPIEFKRTGDDWAYFRPHKATVMTRDNGTNSIFITGELYKNNLYVKQGANYVKGNSILMFVYGQEMFTSSREGFIEARTKEYLFNSSKLIKYGNYVYLLEIGRPVLRTQMVPIFGTTPYTTLDGTISFAIQSTENDISSMKLLVTGQMANQIDVMDEIVPEVGYDGKYVSIGKFDVYSVSESAEMADPTSYNTQYTVDAISSGLGRAFTFVSDNFYELWGTDTVLIDKSNYLGRAIVYNGPFKDTLHGLMFDPEKFTGNVFSAIPFLKTTITHTRSYDIIANFKFPDSGTFEIEISPIGYTTIDDNGVAQQSGLTIGITGQAGSNGNANAKFYVNRVHKTSLNGFLPYISGKLSVMVKTIMGRLDIYTLNSNSVWTRVLSYWLPTDVNNDDTNEGYCSALVGFRVKYQIADRTVLGKTKISWIGNEMPFLTGIYNNDGNKIHEANPCFTFDGIQSTFFWSQLQNATVSGAQNIQISTNSFQITNGIGETLTIYPRLRLPLANGGSEITVNVPSGKFNLTQPGSSHGTAWPFYLNETIKYRYNAWIDKGIIATAYGSSIANGFDSYRGIYSTIMRFNYGSGNQNFYYAVVEIMGTMPQVPERFQNADTDNIYLFCILRNDGGTTFSPNPTSITFYPVIVVGKIARGTNTIFDHFLVRNSGQLLWDNAQRRGFKLNIPNESECYIPGIVTTFDRVNIAIENLSISSTRRPISLLEAANYLFHISGITNLDCEYIYNGNVTGTGYDFTNQINRSSAKVTYRVNNANDLLNKNIGVFNGLSMSSDRTKFSGYLVTARNSDTKGYLSLYNVTISSGSVQEQLVYSVELDKPILGDVSFYTSDGYTSVTIGNTLMHTFAYDRIVANATYDINVIMIYITSDSTFYVKLSAVDDVIDYYAVDMGMDGGTNYSNLVSERRIYCRDKQDGGVYLYRNPTLYDNQSNPIDVYEVSRNYSSSALLTNVRAEGSDAIELIDPQLTKYYGKHFAILPTFNVDGIGNLLAEAKTTIMELASKMNSYRVIGGADPRIEVGDKLYVRVVSSGTISTRLLRITAVNMYGAVQGNECSFEMEIEGYEQ